MRRKDERNINKEKNLSEKVKSERFLSFSALCLKERKGGRRIFENASYHWNELFINNYFSLMEKDFFVPAITPTLSLSSFYSLQCVVKIIHVTYFLGFCPQNGMILLLYYPNS